MSLLKPNASHSPAGHAGETVDIDLLENDILPQVFKPARYVGLEQGAYRKPFAQAAVTMAFAFPDLYEIGISNYGMKLFYSLVNQNPDYLCDRVYAPAPDMKAKLAEYGMPLYGVETLVPLQSFDLLAFTLQYELNYTTILGLLESAQIPLRSAERLASEIDYPLLIAGGPGSANPMPLAPFFDAFIIGDGEEVLIEMLDVIRQGKSKGLDKPLILKNLAQLEGVYIPGVTEKAYKRIIDIAEHPVDIAPLIPAIQAVHDRVTIEARRGCDRMCRFCQPCFINLPVREQSIEQIKKSALSEIEKTGYEECSLLSLSIADYSYFKPMIMEVAEALEEDGISLSLPSQRADRFSLDVAEAIQKVRKSTLTFAPEAGTKRLRDVINKNLTDEEILNAVTSAYQAGWNKVKLYFIIGLPTETLDDLDGIVATVKLLQDACAEIKREQSKSIKKHLEVNVTLSNFVPKPHTPFQWFPQDTMETLYGKIRYIKEQFSTFKGVKLNFTDPEISKLEAFISKGGPELADILELAYEKGAYLDAWDDVNNFQKWFDAISELGPELGIEGWEQYTRERCCDPEATLPWDAIDVGLNKQWLKDEYEKAKAEASTVPCFEACSTCGVCANYNTWPKFIETPPYLDGKAPAANAQDTKPTLKERLSTFFGGENPRLEEKTSETSPPDALPEHKLKREPVAKLRLQLEKQGKMKFISHLDWLRLIYRSVIRAKLPVAYSQGFNPKPKISFGPALPLFSESQGEFVDVELSRSIEPRELEMFYEALNPLLPEGGKLRSVTEIPLRSKSIDKSIKTLTYQAIPLLNRDAEDERLLSSIKQATCQSPLKRYTEEDRLHWLQTKLAPHLTAFANGEALQYRLPLEFDSQKRKKPSQKSRNGKFQKNKSRKENSEKAANAVTSDNTDLGSQTRPTQDLTAPAADANRILNLTPSLEDFCILPNGRIQFRLRRKGAFDPKPDTDAKGVPVLDNRNPEYFLPEHFLDDATVSANPLQAGQSLISAERHDAESSTLPDPTPALINTGVKPAWVLNFIDPNIKWSLIRTDIELEV
ncbi:MAG: TIGR03936 family radical SAM-associated protein [Vampirovibrionales bacterium]|nr:TIGR03936 family radical SAM-associated protein [Vampirovibrionales bacterium]